VVDNTGDVVAEPWWCENEDVDTVQSSITYTLGGYIENLTLTGDRAINGYGNNLSNLILGNNAHNTLYGYDGNDILDGGEGADTMYGGAGDDIYFVDDTGDVVVENTGEGVDTIISPFDYDLRDKAYIENLELIEDTDAINGYGNDLNNAMQGNSRDNVLYGYEGADSIVGAGGNDMLYGGGGNDKVWGSDGNDFLDGGEGADTMFGGTGDDTCVVDNAGDTVIELFKRRYRHRLVLSHLHPQ